MFPRITLQVKILFCFTQPLIPSEFSKFEHQGFAQDYVSVRLFVSFIFLSIEINIVSTINSCLRHIGEVVRNIGSTIRQASIHSSEIIITA